MSWAPGLVNTLASYLVVPRYNNDSRCPWGSRESCSRFLRSKGSCSPCYGATSPVSNRWSHTSCRRLNRAKTWSEFAFDPEKGRGNRRDRPSVVQKNPGRKSWSQDSDRWSFLAARRPCRRIASWDHCTELAAVGISRKWNSPSNPVGNYSQGRENHPPASHPDSRKAFDFRQNIDNTQEPSSHSSPLPS